MNSTQVSNMFRKTMVFPVLAMALSAPSMAQQTSDNSAALPQVIAARSAEEAARDGARHPQETRQPMAGEITVDATLQKDGNLTGSAQAKWGVAYQAKGTVTGTATPTR